MYDLVPSDYISQCVAFLGVFEPKLSACVRSIGAEGAGKLLVDVGANMGYFSLIWLAANPENRVVAFEPNRRNLDLLQSNFQKNSLETRSTVYTTACSDRAGILMFDLGPQAQTGWGSLAVTDHSRSTEVAVVTLDQTFANGQQIDLLKIDTEGADYLVLKGAEQLLRSKRISQIYFEMNIPRMKYLGISLDDVRIYFSSVDYDLWCVEGLGRPVSTWYARPRAGGRIPEQALGRLVSFWRMFNRKK